MAGALLAAAVAGLAALGWSTGDVFFHLVLGLLFGYVGFFAPNHGYARSMVGGLGVLVIVIKAAEMLGMWLLFAMPLQFAPHQLTCLPVGITAILAALYLPGDEPGGVEPGSSGR